MNKNIIIAALTLVTGCVTNTIDGYSVKEMKNKTIPMVFNSSNGTKLPYRIYVSNYSIKSPLVVFLHGAGERGTDNERQISYGINSIAKFVDENIEDGVLVAPQCPPNLYWKSDNIMEALKEFVIYMSKNPYVDKNRIYMTGFSMGGEGTWIFGLKNPDIVTTMIPLCGGPLSTDKYGYCKVPEEIKNNNIWSFNYFDDDVVDNTYSRYVMSKIWSINTNNFHYTEILKGGHTADMYNNKLLMQWMFGTKKH